ncbi:recombinase family protein [Halococcus sp. IIIV-5B]|uniref:recombinase family protein n=1 Tax=Halococcus sp. IIIV-5B TaxID=2321230 RepID=UPI000E71C7C3|nr:recombinase family protein [Halococcus sp. IIIV-5B]RJS99469.1 recombinase family protein [Halococcus sp. IIIV-5B]
MATQSDTSTTEGATVGYVRVLPNTGTVADQRERILRYAERDLDLNPANVSMFSDEGAEARADQSSGYQAMLDRVATAAVGRVIVTDAARVAKTVVDFNEFVETLLDAGVALHVLDIGLELGEPGTVHADRTDAPDERAILQGLSIAADIEASVSTERTREGIHAAKASGKHVGRPPYGFDSENGRLVPNDDFNTALLVIERLRDGKSKRSTAKLAGVTRTTVQNIVDRSALYAEHMD